MKIEIDNYELVDQASIAVPNDASVLLMFQLGNWKIPIRIVFVTTSGEDKDRALNIKTDSGEAVLEFMNWSSPLGTATRTPVYLGKTDDGRELKFMAVHYTIGKINSLQLHFLLRKRADAND